MGLFRKCSRHQRGVHPRCNERYTRYPSGLGYVFFFKHVGSTWTLESSAQGNSAFDIFGSSVAVEGNTALIGAHGTAQKAYIYLHTGSSWYRAATLQPGDGSNNDWFGYSCDLSGNTAIVGKYGDDTYGDGSGSAYVYTGSGSSWTQQQKLYSPNPHAHDQFGISVTVQGDTAFIGASTENNSTGAVYVFTRSAGIWTFQQRLTSDHPTQGSSFGGRTALQGNTAFIGAMREDACGIDSGAAYVFTKKETGWVQTMKVLPSDGQAGDLFGSPVSLDQGTVVIGARGCNDNGNNSGAAYVFVFNGHSWDQSAKLLASDGYAGDSFGEKLELHNGNVIIGAPYANDSGVLHSGAAYVFSTEPPNKLPHPAFSWTPQYPFPHQQTTFDASASYDTYGSIVKYEWDWNNDGVYDESHTTPTAVHMWTQPGGYLVTLRITDNVGGIAVLSHDVKIRHFQWANYV